MVSVQRKINIAGIILFIFCQSHYALETSNLNAYTDSIPMVDSLAPIPQTQTDTIYGLDTLHASRYADTLTHKKEKPLDSKVDYSASDTMIISMKAQKIFLYNNAQVNYEDIELKANYIDFDMANNRVHASGLPDSSGVMKGEPEFKQKDEAFTSKTMDYNFKSQKGKIYDIVTQEGEGYLHSKETKRLPNSHIDIKDGKYTTCNLDHPHFYIGLTKAIVIPEDKIVSGPAYLVLADIPLPLMLPFGFFPNNTKRSSGLKIPTYGQENRRGFYLRNGGWYFAINDYIDITLLGDIYTRGPYALHAISTYRKKYRYSGSFSGSYVNNKIRNLPNESSTTQYNIIWTYRQDQKANPTRTFSANVNMSSTEYNQQNSYNINNYFLAAGANISCTAEESFNVNE